MQVIGFRQNPQSPHKSKHLTLNTLAVLKFKPFWIFLLIFLTLQQFSCTHSGKYADPQFQKAYDSYKLPYSEFLVNPPFTSGEQLSIYAQLPIAQLQSGDIILRLMDGASSILTAFSCLGGFSHVGIILWENDSLMVVDCQPHNATEMGGHSIKKHYLSDWVGDVIVHGDTSEVLSISVLRCTEAFSKSDLQNQVDQLLYGNVKFDSQFELDNDLQDTDLLYCSEFIYVIYKNLLGRDDFIFYSDPITNRMIEQVSTIEEENRYPDFFRMLHIIESRFQMNLRNVDHLISPSAFEYSLTFQPIYFARHPQLHSSGYLPILTLYAFMQRSIIVLRALHGLPVNTKIENAFNYADLSAAQKSVLRRVITQQIKENAADTFNGDQLILRLLSEYAGSSSTLDLIEKAVSKLEPPKGHREG